MFKDINKFNWTNYFTNLKINFQIPHINNYTFYEKIKMKKKNLNILNMILNYIIFFLTKIMI